MHFIIAVCQQRGRRRLCSSRLKVGPCHNRAIVVVFIVVVRDVLTRLVRDVLIRLIGDVLLRGVRLVGDVLIRLARDVLILD